MDSENLINIEAELIGECLNRPKILESLNAWELKSDDFLANNLKKIYDTILKAYKKYGIITPTLVATENTEIKISEIAELAKSTFNVDVRTYTKIIKDASYDRRCLNISNNIALKAIGEKEGATLIKALCEERERSNQLINSDSTLTTLDKVDIVDLHKAEKLKSGFKQIDEKILGFMMGSLVVITGYNGSGKSTLINQMCIGQALHQGYKVFAYSPELTNSNFKSWLYPTLANTVHLKTIRSKEDKYYTVVSKDGIKLLDEWTKDKIQLYSDRSITYNPEELLSNMRYLAEKGYRVFTVDNLMKLDLYSNYKDIYAGQKDFTNKLKDFARNYNALVFLVAHPRKPQEQGNCKLDKFDISGSSNITDLADYVIGINRVTNAMRIKAAEGILSEQKKEKGAKDKILKVEDIDVSFMKDASLSIMKDRPTGNEEFAIYLSFDKSHRRFYDADNELNEDYGYMDNIELIPADIETPFDEEYVNDSISPFEV